MTFDFNGGLKFLTHILLIGMHVYATAGENVSADYGEWEDLSEWSDSSDGEAISESESTSGSTSGKDDESVVAVDSKVRVGYVLQ